MPIREQCFNICSMDIIYGLPSIQGYNTIFTCIDEYTMYVQLIPCFKGEKALSVPDYTSLFFSNIARLFGITKWCYIIMIQG